jgi:hypothetical protein
MPRRLLVLLLLLLPPVLRPRVERLEPMPLELRALPVVPVLALVVRPAVSSPPQSLEPLCPPMFSAHSPIWSLRLLIWSLIWLRRDHRNTPAPTAAAAAAAAANGRSRAISIMPELLDRLLPLLLPPRLPRLL